MNPSVSVTGGYVLDAKRRVCTLTGAGPVILYVFYSGAGVGSFDDVIVRGSDV